VHTTPSAGRGSAEIRSLDAALDDLATLAAQVCETPVALILLNGTPRRWHRSNVGRGGLDLSHIHFYAGIALRSAEGDALGALCVIDHARRQLTAAQQRGLEVIGRQIAAQLELGRTRKQAFTDAHIRHLNRVHAVLTDINQTIVREPDPQKMLEAACRVAVEKGGFRMAWIGIVDEATNRAVIRAHAGADAGAIDIIGQLIYVDPPAGCIFTHRALFTGQYGVCDDIAKDARTAAWRDAALSRGYLSMAAFPLKTGDRVIGVFNIYAGETGFFDAEELRLLVGLADDMSFALDVHQREQERERAEEQRRLAEERFRHLQEQFLQAQKMESIGRLAGGIAHDFNNLLTVINGTTDLVMAGLDLYDPLRHELQEIRLAGDRAATLTGQLLALSRRQMLQPEVLDLSKVVGDLRGMLRRLINEDIELVFNLASPIARVRVDPGQLEQVILNLAVNAQDAMPDGGTLIIETRDVLIDAGHASAHPATRPGAHVMLAVSDTGIGMDEATRLRIFEPFFTTKAQGKGTGLGLSTVYGIVEQSRGTIWVYSEPGQGTTFKIYLPAFEVVPSEAQPTRQPSTHGHETILLVEDERGVRDLTRRILESAGYTVLAAGNGPEAIALLEQHAGPIDLLMTDVVMPGMNGRELAARIAELRPEAKVLYASGYTDDAILRHGVLDDSSRFISKPYTQVELTRRVRSILDA
jgi:signal transduction histidine kinase